MSLSICLLTHDAEPHLERVLRSVAALGAEVIVADTGSKDGTVAAAQALGAKVGVVPWQEDFAAAQNLALEWATGDWILWLNPDEEWMSPESGQVEALLAREEALAYGVRVQEMRQPDERQPAVESWAPRLFRRLPELRFLGRLHPHFVTPLEELAQRQNKQIYRTELLIRHHAYLSKLTEEKLRWATRLLELELADRPGQLHYLIEYGRNLLRLQNPRGHEILAEAAELVWANANAPRPSTPTVASLLEYLLTVSSKYSRSPFPREQVWQIVQRWFPNSPPLLWAQAQWAFQAKDFQQAAQLLETLVSLGRTGTYDHSTPFHPTVMGEAALLNLGRCYLALGDPDRARPCFTQLLSSSTHQAEAHQGLAQAKAQRRQGK